MAQVINLNQPKLPLKPAALAISSAYNQNIRSRTVLTYLGGFRAILFPPLFLHPVLVRICNLNHLFFHLINLITLFKTLWFKLQT